MTSPFIAPLSEQEIPDHVVGWAGERSEAAGGQRVMLPEGMTARRFMAEMMRQTLAHETGHDFSHAADAELLDPMLYNVFPNMSFWGGYLSNIIYRWRPNGFSPDETIMDIMILKPSPKDGPRPKPAPKVELGLDDPMSMAAEHMGPMLTPVFTQDMANLPYVQEGLRASGNGLVYFGNYSELRLRALHDMIDRYIAEGRARESASPRAS